MKYLLDSNIVSEPSKPIQNEKVIKLIEKNRDNSAIAAISFFEMLHGVLVLPEGKRKKSLEEYLEKTVVPFYDFLSYDILAARIQAELSAKLQSIGKLTPYQDTQMASIAISKNLVLVTRNVKDFENILKVSNLKIENWFEK